MIKAAEVIVDKKPLRIISCSEIQDMVSGLSYLNSYFSDYLKDSFLAAPKILYKDIRINFPKNGRMFIKTGKGTKIISGKIEELMTIYILANQYQRGENSCKYCKRPDSRCQIKGFLKEVEATTIYNSTVV